MEKAFAEHENIAERMVTIRVRFIVFNFSP